MTNKYSIVGGVNIERCSKPSIDTIMGSGLRSCFVFENLSTEDYTFYTSLPETVLNHHYLKSMISADFVNTESGIFSEYYYPFPSARPTLSNKVHSPNDGGSKNITVNCALVFGMLEERYTIQGQRIVYDPQNRDRSQHFFENKRNHARELVIIANLSEIVAMSRSTDAKSLSERMRELSQEHNLNAIICKLGPHGAVLFSEDKFFHAQPIFSKRIFKIGSGDVFSASFFVKWVVENATIEEAFLFSNAMTARFVETNTFSTESLKLHEQLTELPETFDLKDIIKRKRIYLAGPFFTTSEIWLVEEARRILIDFDMDVISPYHDHGIITGPKNRNEIVKKDIDAIKECDVFVALLENFDPGTCAEIGIAQQLEKPVYIYCPKFHDSRINFYAGLPNTNLFDNIDAALFWSATKK